MGQECQGARRCARVHIWYNRELSTFCRQYGHYGCFEGLSEAGRVFGNSQHQLTSGNCGGSRECVSGGSRGLVVDRGGGGIVPTARGLFVGMVVGSEEGLAIGCMLGRPVGGLTG